MKVKTTICRVCLVYILYLFKQYNMINAVKMFSEVIYTLFIGLVCFRHFYLLGRSSVSSTPVKGVLQLSSSSCTDEEDLTIRCICRRETLLVFHVLSTGVHIRCLSATIVCRKWPSKLNAMHVYRSRTSSMSDYC